MKLSRSRILVSNNTVGFEIKDLRRRTNELKINNLIIVLNSDFEYS
jgi:hypothetical protein